MSEPHEPYSLIRKLLPFTTAAIIVAALYVGWIFFSRWQETRSAEAQAKQQEVEAARKTIEAYGNGSVKIMSFSITPSVASRGEKIRLCYGVSNAKTVTIEPKPDEEVWPSLARCVEASPTKTTTYKLVATDAAGHTEERSLTLQVQ